MCAYQEPISTCVNGTTKRERHDNDIVDRYILANHKFHTGRKKRKTLVVLLLCISFSHSNHGCNNNSLEWRERKKSVFRRVTKNFPFRKSLASDNTVLPIKYMCREVDDNCFFFSKGKWKMCALRKSQWNEERKSRKEESRFHFCYDFLLTCKIWEVNKKRKCEA